ncbi:hypothetical protein [Microbulbifer sp. TRSA001]|uniref:hypothetical protein n=1 Tax=unclassified Microbulbifer TaxID=2619833 RepID=UPI00403A94AD
MTDFYGELLKGYKESRFFDCVNMLSENYGGDKRIAEALSKLHNEGNLNLTEEFIGLENVRDRNFFQVTGILSDALPMVNAPVSEVVACLEHLKSESENGSYPGLVIEGYVGFCKAKQGRAKESVDAVLALEGNSFGLLSPALIAGSNKDKDYFVRKAISLLLHENIKVVSQAAFSLGRIDFKTDDQLLQKTVSSLSDCASAIDEDEALSSVLKSLLTLSVKHQNLYPQIKNVIDRVLDVGDDFVVDASAYFLAYEREAYPEGLRDQLFGVLSQVKAKNKGTLGLIGTVLTKMLKTGNYVAVVSYMEQLLSASDSGFSIESFGHVKDQFIESESCRNYVATKWLLSKKQSLLKALSNLIDFGEKGHKLSLDIGLVEGLSPEEFVDLAEKACGWIFTSQVSAASFLLSLLKICPNDAVDPIKAILYNPLLISFPGSVKEYLVEYKKAQECEDTIAGIIDDLMEKLDQHNDGIALARRVKELRPSTADREAYNRNHSRLMSEAYANAPKGFLSSLFKTSVLLYGHKSIHHVYPGPNGEGRKRQEMPLHSISHSLELPSLELYDSNGLEYILYVFRYRGCEK